MAQACFNVDFNSGHAALITRKDRVEKKNSNSAIGSFHMLPFELQQSMFTVSIKYVPKPRVDMEKVLFGQQGKKQRWEDFAREKKIIASKDDYIIALYYHENFASAACWKTVNQVDQEIERLHSVSSKLNAMKEQIRIRFLGFLWCCLYTTWSYKGTVKSPESLAGHLKNIIKEETSRPIPNKPLTNLTSQKHVPTFCTFYKHVIAMDCSRSKKYHGFKYYVSEILYDRESDGFGDRYMEIQTVSIPAVDHSLVSKNIEILFELIDPYGTCCLEWCKGNVISVRKAEGKNQNNVTVLWN